MRKIQNRVSEFEALFRIISEYAQVGYANYNLYNKEGYAQNVWLRNYGEADSAQIVDVIGKYRHIHPEDRKPLLDLLTRFSAGEVQSATAICRVQHDDGRKTWIKTHLICRDYRPGEQVIDMLGINYDITALKQTEQELIAAKERAEEAARKAWREQFDLASARAVAALPMLALAFQLTPVLGFLYAVLLFAGMFTAALSSLYAITTRVQLRAGAQLRSKRFTALLCILAFVGSIFGFKNVVSVVYPICGYIGFLALVGILLHFMYLKKARHNRQLSN